MCANKKFSHEEAKQIGDTLGIDWGVFNVEQFQMGLDVELEHGTSDEQTNVTNDDAFQITIHAWQPWKKRLMNIGQMDRELWMFEIQNRDEEN